MNWLPLIVGKNLYGHGLTPKNRSSIVRQVTGSKILDFFYDENGNLYGFKDDGEMYYYVRNGQSDIIGILDNNGVQVVYYQYDSWGNPLTPTGSSASTIGADNPFRYRGYYLDSETGLYYLNSRYYDSTVGRFINADGLISASSSLLGTNMYSYCQNNPVSYRDQSGLFWESILDFGKNVVRVLGQAVTTLKAISLAPIYVGLMACAVVYGLATGDVSLDEVTEDLSNIDFFNTSEESVIKSKVIAFYKGIPVIRQDISSSSFSFGAIFLKRDVIIDDTETLNHEYGHSVQFGILGLFEAGPLLYAGLVAVPSVTFYNYDYMRGNWDDYYKRPWEASADFFGGIERQ